MSKIERVRLATAEDACNILGLDAKEQKAAMIATKGFGWFELRNEEDQTLKELGVFTNLVTDVGDAYYAKRASNAGSQPAQVTGMKLGTSSTVPAKNGSTSFIISYVTGSSVAIDGTHPQFSQTAGAGAQIQWQTTWVAGVATATGIQEVTIVNTTIATDTGGTEAGTISRANISPQVDKAAGDQLIVIWNHLLKGQ